MGVIDVGVGSQMTINGVIAQTAGRMIADGTVTATNSIVHIEHGELSGSGSVQPGLLCGGTVSPGNPLGTLAVAGSAQLQSSGTLRIELGGATPGVDCDRFVASGAVWLGGTLTVEVVNGFEPQPGDEFECVQGTVIGQFADVETPPLDPGACWQVEYLPTAVRLRVVRIPGDLNGDGETGLEDLATLLGNFGQPGVGREDGDLDGDEDVDLSDLTLMLSEFGHSCG